MYPLRKKRSQTEEGIARRIRCSGRIIDGGFPILIKKTMSMDSRGTAILIYACTRQKQRKVHFVVSTLKTIRLIIFTKLLEACVVIAVVSICNEFIISLFMTVNWYFDPICIRW